MDIFKEIINWPTDCKVIINSNEFIIYNNDHKFIISYELDNQLVVIKKSNDIYSNHLYRICNIQDIYTMDEIFNLLTIISEKISNPFKYCTICGKYDNILVSDIGSCSESCREQAYALWTSNIIKENYVYDKLVLKLFIETMISGAKSNRRNLVFDPFPKMIKDFDDMDTLLVSDLFSNNYTKIMQIINTSVDDSEILNKLGDKIYGLLKFTILSSNFKLKSINLSKNAEIISEPEFYKDIICYEIIHDIVKTKVFDIIEPEYLYHGSNIGNWYSIMRNGLKNCSGTKLMSSGAAYGNGIYLSNNANLSNSYSNSIGIQNTIKILGIVQVLDREKYNKGHNVYVVPEEDKVLLKYLIVFPNSKCSPHEYIINFISNRENQIKKSNNSMFNIMLKRLAKELEIIRKKYSNLKINIVHGECKIIWKITFEKKFDINILIIFTSHFPTEPPFIMIESPIVNIEPNNNIFNEGHIYLDEISPKLWNPKTKIINVISKLEELFNKLKISKYMDHKYEYSTVLKEYDNLLKKNNKY